MAQVLVWIPAYNEEESVAYMIDRIKELGLDMVLSDGASTDRTAQIANSKGVKVSVRSGPGKGSSIIDALEYAHEHQYEFIVLIDCDKTYDPADIPKLIEASPGMDMVVGCRPFKDITFLRRIANVLMTSFVNILYGASSKDMGSGLRLIRTERFAGRITARDFGAEPQIHAIAVRDNYDIAEVDISYRNRMHSKSRVWHLPQVFIRLFKERFRASK